VRKLVKEEDFERTVGKGRTKHKETVSRRERVRLLREAAEKPKAE
jgi:hypothetical protein